MKSELDLGCFPTGRHYPGIAHLLRVVAAGIIEEFVGTTALDELEIVSIDTETTGRDPLNDRIVEIAAVIWHRGEIKSRHSWLINPGCPIPAETVAVHGIDDEAVKDCPAFAELAGEIASVLNGRVPLAYNAEFDLKFIHQEYARTQVELLRVPPALRRGVEWLDPLVWARELQKYEKSKALGEVCSRLGIELTNAHRATNDAEAAMHVFACFAKDTRVPKTYAAFVQEQRRLARIQEEERARWRAGRGG
ncbi:MAG TPA: 3'-5' exonuclease [Polyangiaceae bacterium]|nr:3'-5' exonuclease [Polyangiaceae bacterium]